MNSNGDGGPARTRTWDQGIMSNTVTLRPWKKAEEAQQLFRYPSRPTASTELIPNALPKSRGLATRKVDRAHRVARPNRPNRAEHFDTGRLWRWGESPKSDAPHYRKTPVVTPHTSYFPANPTCCGKNRNALLLLVLLYSEISHLGRGENHQNTITLSSGLSTCYCA